MNSPREVLPKMRRIVDGALRRIGHRGSMLGICAITVWCYGAGIIAGYRPTFAAALGVDLIIFGWMFIALGVIAATGMIVRNDAAHFALCVCAITAWILLLATHWSAPFGWTAAISWLGLDLALIVTAAWPEYAD